MNYILELEDINNLIDNGDFKLAFKKIQYILKKNNIKKNYSILSSLAMYSIDIGGLDDNIEASNIGIKIFEDNKYKILKFMDKSLFYYNLGNAKINFIPKDSILDIKNNQSFYDIEKLIEIKSYYWKAIKYSLESNIEPEYIVNLGNILKQQFRLVEALDCYDRVNSLNMDIPQSWINKSESLILLHQISDTSTIKMLEEIKNGYINAIPSKEIPPQWIEYYRKLIEDYESQIQEIYTKENIDIDNIHKTQLEYEQLSDLRKFYLDKNLSLSEHGLYCKCNGSSIDDLRIFIKYIDTDIMLFTEKILNHIKSEFSFSRSLYYEYLTHKTSIKTNKESFYFDFDSEVFGLDIEKIKTSFKLCFGILDKIGIAICELYNLYPANNIVYFQSFWQLDRDNRREKFEKIKTPALLALYSIATDLNDKKNGELAFFKEYRNNLEHKFMVIYKNKKPNNSYKFKNDIIFVEESIFIKNLEQLLQLTRSAIFSFVFMVRETSLQKEEISKL